MLRSMLNSCLKVGGVVSSLQNSAATPLVHLCKPQFSRSFSAIVSQNHNTPSNKEQNFLQTLLRKPIQQNVSPLILQQPSRTVIKFSFSGKRQCVKSVPARFKRLDWGIWIRRIAGAHKKLWKKSNARRMRMERHVLVNAKRSYTLDKMVTRYWRTPKYWVDDPYEPYHKREEFPFTRKNPRPLPPGVSFSRGSNIAC